MAVTLLVKKKLQTVYVPIIHARCGGSQWCV